MYYCSASVVYFVTLPINRYQVCTFVLLIEIASEERKRESNIMNNNVVIKCIVVSLKSRSNGKGN